jgi:Pvc16 N-terminal domain/IPT/TIG domain
MSSPLAIASVTYVLKDLLNNGLIDLDVSGATFGNVNVSALPPDRIDLTTGGQSQLNLYMYAVTFNPGWRNIELPSADARGERISNPPLALNLHYLLTSYGLNELHTEILLGYGMHLLHQNPVLDRKAIRRSLTSGSAGSGGGLPDELRALSTSELAEQMEQIKIAPENLSTEEISKLWTAFSAKYRPTAAYQVSVVLIESKESTKSALRVKERNIYVNPFHQPEIEKILSQKKDGDQIVEDQPVLAGYNLIITGRQLISDDVKVRVGGIEVTPVKNDITDTQILISLPDGLTAGVQSVQVIHDKMMGTPVVLHHGTESNVAAFVLNPSIEEQELISGPSIKLTVTPGIKYNQRVILLLNEYRTVPSVNPPLSYAFHAPVRSEDPGITNELTIPVKGVKTADYLVRIKVDGAESPLKTDAEGNYDSPMVSIS